LPTIARLRIVDVEMEIRPVLLAWLVTCVAVLPPVMVDGSATVLAAGAASLVCLLAFSLLRSLPPGLVGAPAPAPVTRRVRGRFLQQSRPGVPGRTRARAPGCGR
jgi:hypothetical protein